jgi:PAS domain S-box-containing protein
MNDSQPDLSAYAQQLEGENRQLKKALAHSRQRFELLAKATSEVVWDLDLESNRIWWNEGFQRLFGYSKEQSDSLDFWYSLLHPLDVERVMTSLQACIERGDTQWSVEYRFRKADGSYAYILDRGYLMGTEQGKPIRMVGSMQDLTARKTWEQTLRVQSRAIECAAEGVVITDPTLSDPAMEDNPIIFVNDKFCIDSGYSKSELIGKNCRLMQGIDSDQHAVDKIREAIREQTPFRGEILNYKKDGSPFWCFLVIAPVLDEEGKLTHFVGLFSDISERKQVEANLAQHNEQLVKVNSELDHFVYSVSHNLRAPLTSLLGLIAISKLTTQIPERDQYLGLMEKSIYKLDATIGEINDYVKNARLDLQLDKIDFNELLAEVMEGLAYMEEAKHINISMQIQAPVDFYSDKGRLAVVVSNLLSNAIKYHDRRKADPYIKIAVQVTSISALLTIEDNGLGIGEEHQGKIFTMFYRASSQSSGSGLGLFIVREKIHKLQGSIRLRSILGQGSEFILEVPNLTTNV